MSPFHSGLSEDLLNCVQLTSLSPGRDGEPAHTGLASMRRYSAIKFAPPAPVHSISPPVSVWSCLGRLSVKSRISAPRAPSCPGKPPGRVQDPPSRLVGDTRPKKRERGALPAGVSLRRRAMSATRARRRRAGGAARLAVRNKLEPLAAPTRRSVINEVWPDAPQHRFDPRKSRVILLIRRRRGSCVFPHRCCGLPSTGRACAGTQSP